MLASLADSEVRRQAAFAIAMIALSAKMAKADGVVTRPEVDAFCRIFTIPPGEEKNVSRVYNLAKRDIAGFEAYARDVARLLADDPAMLEAILDGLFDIAKADGAVHERELAYLARVAELFGFDEPAFARIRARHVIDRDGDPYLVLDADRDLGLRAPAPPLPPARRREPPRPPDRPRRAGGIRAHRQRPPRRHQHRLGEDRAHAQAA